MITEQHWGLLITDRVLHTHHIVDYGPCHNHAQTDANLTPRPNIKVELVTRTATYTDWETTPVEAAPDPT